ncbi:hypothetical protein C8J57DRAFT_1223308 [Mycena rebaudengoi]|nr:hypothetical protein C8J57DRAFT_1223308 [Mycena rebaudengoi]
MIGGNSRSILRMSRELLSMCEMGWELPAMWGRMWEIPLDIINETGAPAQFKKMEWELPCTWQHLLCGDGAHYKTCGWDVGSEQGPKCGKNNFLGRQGPQTQLIWELLAKFFGSAFSGWELLQAGAWELPGKKFDSAFGSQELLQAGAREVLHTFCDPWEHPTTQVFPTRWRPEGPIIQPGAFGPFAHAERNDQGILDQIMVFLDQRLTLHA